MNQASLVQLQEVSDQLTLLASTFQTRPFCLRVKQIRQADKALAGSDAFFSQDLAVEAKQWKEAADGLKILHVRLAAVKEKQVELEKLENQIATIRKTIQGWTTLDETEKNKLIQNAKRAQTFIKHNLEQSEAHILHKYKRFSALKALTPYADKASYLCEAIYHYENREKYDTNLKKLTQKTEHSLERLKVINRGFWLALILCFLVVTIPICLPFALSLWRRKKALKTQIENGEEIARREQKRIAAATEGAAVAQDIRSHLGEMSLEQIRDTLAEVRDLRSEFQGPESSSSNTAVLLNFIDSQQEKLTELFGKMPDDYVEVFKWFSNTVEKNQETEVTIASLDEKREATQTKMTQLSKGYAPEMLLASIEKLEAITKGLMHFPFDLENKKHFATICIEIPNILGQIRETLFFVSKNHPIDDQYWDFLQAKIQGYANTLSLCILNAEFEARESAEETMPTSRKESVGEPLYAQIPLSEATS